MKTEIENLKAWMSGRSTTGYQRALAMREFEQLLTYVAELEQLRQPPVVGRSEQLIAKEQDAFDKGYTKGWTEGFNSGKVNCD